MKPAFFLRSRWIAFFSAAILATLNTVLVFASDASTSQDATSQNAGTERWNAKFQATYIWQEKNAFQAPYSGPNSLSTHREDSYSLTATAYFGLRLWNGGELYFDPEATQGKPLSRLTGLGGFSNGEMARTSGPNLTVYRARLFLRQTWNTGDATEKAASDENQLAGGYAKRRWVLTAGNLSVLDIFDDNTYNHDPRTQFMNWALMTYGAYDYAADARGYSWGAALEWYDGDSAIRIGRFMQPKEPNGESLDHQVFQHYGDQIEFEHDHTLAGQPGKVRVLVFRNRAKMARYEDAIDLAEETNTTPDINAVRFGNQIKTGFGLNLEQAITNDIGLFARASKDDGKTETYAFTEIDSSLSAGFVIQGSAWKRADDTIGIAVARDGISKARREYLEDGGISYFIGDGKLNYRPEEILEAFYSLSVIKGSQISLDFQHIANPAYNADRGPVNLFAVRLHTEF